MATFNDALLSPSLNNPNIPNIFELFALESMDHSLRQAVMYAIKVVTGMLTPNYVSSVNEMGLLVEGILQTFSLWNYDATLSEKFYDLKRVLSSSGESLGLLDRLKSLLTIVFVPYVISKLDIAHSNLEYKHEEQPVSMARNGYVMYIFFKCYPYILAAYDAIKFVFLLQYFLKKTLIHSPLLKCICITLNRDLSNKDMNNDSAILSTIVQSMVSFIFPTILFGLKFIEWWYSPDKEDTIRKITQLPIPPAPPVIQVHCQIPDNPLLCPICCKPRRNPTCVITSGFVYCYSCIHKHLSETRNCPVSLIPAGHKQLIRLFPQLLN